MSILHVGKSNVVLSEALSCLNARHSPFINHARGPYYFPSLFHVALIRACFEKTRRMTRKRTRLIIDLTDEWKLVLAPTQESLMSKTANDIILMLSENSLVWNNPPLTPWQWISLLRNVKLFFSLLRVVCLMWNKGTLSKAWKMNSTLSFCLVRLHFCLVFLRLGEEQRHICHSWVSAVSFDRDEWGLPSLP